MIEKIKIEWKTYEIDVILINYSATRSKFIYHFATFLLTLKANCDNEVLINNFTVNKTAHNLVAAWRENLTMINCESMTNCR